MPDAGKSVHAGGWAAPDAEQSASAGAEPSAGAEVGAEDELPAEPETGPLRRCVVTRARLPKERMIRFVVGPERQLVPDLTARLPGRGLWLSASRDVLRSADSNDAAFRTLVRAFARAARGPVTLPPDLLELLQAALVRRNIELLGLARRAGQAVAGFEKARGMLQAGRAQLVVQASDGSMAERARFLSGLGSTVTVIDPLPGKTLGQVFRRDYTGHVAVVPGKLAAALQMEAARLAGLSSGGFENGSEWTRGSPTVPHAGMAQETAGRVTVPVNDEAGANG